MQAKCSEPKLTQKLEMVWYIVTSWTGLRFLMCICVCVCVCVVCQGKEAMISKATEIAEVERQCGLNISAEDAVKELKFGLTEVVYEWANGMAS